jgi:hypothetical protein
MEDITKQLQEHQFCRRCCNELERNRQISESGFDPGAWLLDAGLFKTTV